MSTTSAPTQSTNTASGFGGSLRLGVFAGIGVFVHWSFGLLIAWIVFVHVKAGLPWVETLADIGFILSLFLCVVLHEYGHALTARRYGIVTRDITLLPIGGVARLERMPEKPAQEFVVAVAGPAVNVVIAGVLFATLSLSGQLAGATPESLITGTFWERLMVVNVVLVLFNLLPAFPMDGGRVLRALLAVRLGRRRATRIAASIGQVVAVCLGLMGLLGGVVNPFLIVLAIFVFISAQSEARSVERDSALEGVPVRAAMMTRYRTLDRNDPLAAAVSALLAGSQQDFPVLAEGRLAGLLRRNDLIHAVQVGDREQKVGDAMIRIPAAAEADEPLLDAVTRMQAAGCATLPVLHRGELVGLLTLENIGEFVMLGQVLRERS